MIDKLEDFTEEERQLVHDVDALMLELVKPIFVYRMARSSLDKPGAKTRLLKACNEIEQAIGMYD